MIPTLLSALGLLAGWTAAQDPTRANDETPTARLWTFDELQKRLDDRTVRILDARPRDAYDAGHLPGAVWVDVAAAEKLAARPGGLTDRAAWSEWAAPLAIPTDGAIVVVDDQRQLAAARVWWLLGYLGVTRVGLLDGNVALWAEQQRPMTSDVPEVMPRPLEVAFRADRHASRDEVRAAIEKGTVQVLDARSPSEYTGADVRSKRGGHIPEACNLEWSQLVDARGRFLDPSALRAKLERAGIRPGASVVAHCQGGGRASVATFALERLGHPARNYYLGWSDWGNAEDTPIAGETRKE
jgi:thiosulfate/3-mercaptopyruvate sulfurtransferase